MLFQTKNFLRPYPFLASILFIKFSTMLYQKTPLKYINTAKPYTKFDVLFPYLFLFLFDLLNYIIIFQKVTSLTNKEKRKIDQVKELYTKYIIPGKIAQNSIHFQSQLNEIKSIVPPKTNLFKVMLSNYIHNRLFTNFIVIVLSVTISNIFNLGQFDILAEMLIIVMCSVCLINSCVFMQIHFTKECLKTRLKVMFCFAFLGLLVNFNNFIKLARYVQGFEFFYLFCILSICGVFALEKLNRCTYFYRIKKTIYMIFR